ncbi:MAG: tetratricopeptide repeat protein, partial [Bacteroidetes bacterium]|nr:tetratricopeptide repeat protein [Bacteroidota bacterium]
MMHSILSAARTTCASFCLCILLTTAAEGQQSRIDSLVTLLGSAKEDTVKVRLLSELSQLTRDMDLALSRRYAEEAYALAERRGFIRGMSLACQRLGNVCRDEENHERAMGLFERSLDLGRQVNDASCIAYAYYGIGKCHYSLKDYHRCKEFILRSRKLCERIGHTLYEAFCHHYEGLLFEQEQKSAEAIRAYAVSLRLLEEIDEYGRAAWLCNSLERLHEERGDLDLAERSSRKGGEYFERTGNLEQAAKCWARQAELAARQGRLNDALPVFERALETFKNIGMSCLAALAEGRIAMIFEEQERDDRAHDRYRHALALTRQQPCGLEYGCVSFLLGRFLARQFRYVEALIHLQNALNTFREKGPAGNWISFQHVMMEIAGIHVTQGALDLALEKYKECEAFFISAGDTQGLCICWHNTAGVYEQMGSHDRADEFLRKAVDLAMRAKDSNMLRLARQNQAQIALRRGQTDTAIVRFRQAMDICRKNGKYEWIADAHMAMAFEYYHSLSGYSMALSHAEQALDACRHFNSDTHAAHCCDLLSEIHNKLGRKVEALRYALRGLQLYRKLKNPYGEAKCQKNLGIIYGTGDTFEKAEGYLLSALGIFKELGILGDVSDVHTNLGIVYAHLGDDVQALKHYTAGVLVAKQTELPFLIAAACLELGVFLGKTDDPRSAIPHFDTSLEIYESQGMYSKAAEAYNALGHVYHRLEQDERALVNLHNSVRIASKDNLQLHMRNYEILHHIYANVGRHDSAYSAYKAYIALKDTMENRESRQQINRLMAQLDTEQREAKIRLQTLELARQDEMLRRHAVEGLQRMQEIEL